MKLAGISFTLLATLGVLVLFAAFPGCENGHSIYPNLPPRVSVTGGPPQGGESYYYVTISWVGWDADGTVKYFLYAIDDTTQWTEIRELEETFLFTADSLREGEEFGRWHTFWIKAVDNDGAKSLPDYLTFDARTVAPKTTLVRPCDASEGLCLGFLPVGTSVRIVWEGVDPDCSDPAKKPVAYQWRLVPGGQPDTSSQWSEPGPETEILLRDLAGLYEFAVRATDEAGAIEQVRDGFNQIRFVAGLGYGSPTLYVHEGAAAHRYPADGPVWERRATVNRTITFSWEGDASTYGGTISGYRYGLDIEDLEDPSQWATDWNLNVTSATIQYVEPGTHYLYVQVMDDVETVQLGTVEITVSEFFFDREVLYVDDFFDITPTDLAHDNFTQAILTRCLDYTDSVYVFNCWPPGPGGVPREMTMMVQAPDLSELSRYRFVIWDTDATQNSFDTGFHRVIASGALEAYLNAGGRLWIYGREIVRGSDAEPLSFYYGVVPEAGSFAAEFLHISGVVNRPVITSTTQANGFRRALPNRGVSDLLPTLEIDYAKGGTSTVYGMARVEAVMTAMQDDDLSRRPDTLLFYGDNSIVEAPYDNKACGLRFHDVYSGSKVVYLGFPMHCFFESNAESLATFVTDWMLGDAGPSPRRAARR